MLTAEARERMEHTLDASDHRSITIRRDDVRDTLAALDETGDQADRAHAELSLAQPTTDKSWSQTALEWFGIFLLLLFVAYLGWMGGAGRL